jgi:serine/threonine-protein kinase RsbW
VLTERTFPSRETDLHAVVGHVEHRGAALHLPRPLVLRLCLVVEELFVNTARYAGGVHTESSVHIDANEAGVWLRYADTGPAFNPLEDLAPEALSRTVELRPVGGLGRILVHGLSAEARYERVGERNVLHLRFEQA